MLSFLLSDLNLLKNAHDNKNRTECTLFPASLPGHNRIATQVFLFIPGQEGCDFVKADHCPVDFIFGMSSAVPRRLGLEFGEWRICRYQDRNV